jgi:hypothetical protein
MLTINCPSCQRVLRAPADAGEQQVLCPGCKALFNVRREDATVRVEGALPALFQEAPPRQTEAPTTELTAPVPPVPAGLFFDVDAVRTRRMHTTFKIVAAAGFLAAWFVPTDGAVLNFEVLNCLLAFIIAPLFGAIAAVFVGHFVTPIDEKLNPAPDWLPKRRRRKRSRDARRTNSWNVTTAPPTAIQPEEPLP